MCLQGLLTAPAAPAAAPAAALANGGPKQYTMEEVAEHNHEKSCWFVHEGKVRRRRTRARCDVMRCYGYGRGQDVGPDGAHGTFGHSARLRGAAQACGAAAACAAAARILPCRNNASSCPAAAQASHHITCPTTQQSARMAWRCRCTTPPPTWTSTPEAPTASSSLRGQMPRTSSTRSTRPRQRPCWRSTT